MEFRNIRIHEKHPMKLFKKGNEWSRFSEKKMNLKPFIFFHEPSFMCIAPIIFQLSFKCGDVK